MLIDVGSIYETCSMLPSMLAVETLTLLERQLHITTVNTSIRWMAYYGAHHAKSKNYNHTIIVV